MAKRSRAPRKSARRRLARAKLEFLGKTRLPRCGSPTNNQRKKKMRRSSRGSILELIRPVKSKEYNSNETVFENTCTARHVRRCVHRALCSRFTPRRAATTGGRVWRSAFLMYYTHARASPTRARPSSRPSRSPPPPRSTPAERGRPAPGKGEMSQQGAKTEPKRWLRDGTFP